jgi:A/G-specific adenine glycosylase
MLQQTQVSRVASAFPAFMARFGSVRALAAASLADVLRSWAGLGYHRRAAALHAAACMIVEEMGGEVPGEPEALRRLPGVGDYTAAAVASIAFGHPVAAIDTNVRRIVARAVHGLEPDEVSPSVVRTDAQAWMHPDEPAAWNQALMDLGRTVCRSQPRCGECPLRPWCRFAASGRRGRASAARRSPFEGSLRQTRGAVLAHLRDRSPSTLGAAIGSTGFGRDRVVEALGGLVRDGLVVASGGALKGSHRGTIALPA